MVIDIWAEESSGYVCRVNYGGVLLGTKNPKDLEKLMMSEFPCPWCNGYGFGIEMGTGGHHECPHCGGTGTRTACDSPNDRGLHRPAAE